MADYIDKQATIGAIHSAIYSYFCGAEDGDELSEDEKLVLSVNKAICTAIKAMPHADVQPVRHGKWIDGKRMGYDGVFVWHRECSECGYERKDDNIDNDTPYCPNCGALMDEVTQ